MKKLTVLLLVVLIVLLSFNILLNSSKAQDQTLPSVVAFLDKALNSMTSSELAKLESKFTQTEISRATNFIEDWGILLRMATEAGKILY